MCLFGATRERQDLMADPRHDAKNPSEVLLDLALNSTWNPHFEQGYGIVEGENLGRSRIRSRSYALGERQCWIQRFPWNQEGAKLVSRCRHENHFCSLMLPRFGL
jgi:hypothetical protein